MSLDASRWAWEQTVGKASVKLVLLSLADHANIRDEVYCSVAELQEDTELNRKTIMQCVAALESLGLITDTGNRVGRTGQIKVYRLNGVEHRRRDKSPKSGTVEDRDELEPLKPTPAVDCEAGEESQNRNSTENGTLVTSEGKGTDFGPKESQKRTQRVPKTDSKSPKNGTRNRPGTYQEPVTSSSTSSAGAQVTMPDDWYPCDETIRAATVFHRIPRDFVEAEVLEFRIYWRDAATEKTSWNSAFLQRCVRQWRMRSHEWLAEQVGPRSESQEVFERLTDRSWADGLMGVTGRRPHIERGGRS